MAAATVAVEYPNGDKNPAFLSFSYFIASKNTLLLDTIPSCRENPKRVPNEAPARISASRSFW